MTDRRGTEESGRVTDVAQLRAIYGEVGKRAAKKQIDHLDAHCRAFIAAAPMAFLATSDGARVDVTPRGDRPGFVQTEGESHLLLPDRPGNNRLDSLRNVLANPWAGLVFVIPGEGWTLRVNGAAEIRTDPDLLARFAVDGRLPATVLRVKAEEVFLHCPKAFMRSGLWRPESWLQKGEGPAILEMLKDHAKLAETPDAAQMEAGLRATMY